MYDCIYEFSKTDFVFPDIKTDNCLILEIHLYPERSKNTKQFMYKMICDNLEDIGGLRSDIFIQIIEQPLQNGKMKGGIPADELELNITL